MTMATGIQRHVIPSPDDRIVVIRGKRVILDRDLAELFGVETKYLNRQVRRNLNRFPEEFLFSLSPNERNELVTNWHRFNRLKHSSALPMAFTEHGVAMAATILNSPRAIQMSIFIIHAFARLRQVIDTHRELLEHFRQLEERVDGHDVALRSILEAIRHLIDPATQEKQRPIGY